MGIKLFGVELPLHQTTVDGWTTNIINNLKGAPNGIAPLGADSKVPSANLPTISLAWGSITGVLADQEDLNTALGAKAGLTSPAFNGVPTAPTAPLGTNTIQLATTAFTLSNIKSSIRGMIIAFPVSSVPSGYLECNGSAISRTVYADLFAIIGTLYGSGDGSTTFNLPDLRGEFIRGWDNGRGADSGRGIGTWQNHGFKSHTHSSRYGWGGANGNSAWYSIYTSNANPGTNSGNIVPSTDGGTTETRPRNRAMMYCIKY